MGIGREVADAYIDVHGDLSSFRRDLEKAGPMTEKIAKQQAQEFTDAWGERVEQGVNDKWNSIIDALHSNKQVDWDRMFGEFDSKNLDEAQERIRKFMLSMRQHGKMTKEEYAGAKKALDGVIGNMREQDKLMSRLEQEERGLGMALDANGKFLARMAAENEKWARSFEGMMKNNRLDAMNEDFKSIARAMGDTDWSKFAKGFDNLDAASARVREINTLMIEQKRITAEQADQVQRSIDAYIVAENEKSKAMRDALDETNRLRLAQEKYNKSLDGMVRSANFQRMERDFKVLTDAIASGDWSNLARGSEDMDEMRQRILKTADEMRNLGRMSDAEFRNISTRIDDASRHMRDYNISFRNAGDSTRRLGRDTNRLSSLFSRLNNVTRGLREHLGGFAGLNVFGDMIEGGLEFVHNLDRIALSLTKNTLKFGTMAAVGASAIAGMVTVAADLGNIIGGLAVLAPSFFFGAAIGVGVLTAALQDTDKVLADLKPAFAKLQDDISADFWREAAGPIREAVKALLPIIDNPNGTSTARSLGILVGKLATAFKNIPADKITTMFDRMNRSIDILGNAMAPLIRAFTTLGVVGSKYFERFSTWIVKLTNQFDKFIQRSAANGNLDKWINNAIEGMKNLARVVDGAIGIFNAVNAAAKRAGFGGLKTLADALQDTAAAMQKMAFQKTLTKYLEGARGLTLKVAEAIRGLGPAAESFADTARFALGKIGDAVSRLIGYIGQIFSNPKFQQGVQEFTSGIATAVEHLAPAIKPFGDSLGHALGLLGKIIVSVADIVTAFEVHLGPVLDRISEQLGTLVKPLADTAQNFIKQLGPPLDALNKNVITPIVTIVREKLLPAVNRFFEKLGPILSKVIEDLGPVFVKIVEAMPKAIDLITQLLPIIAKLLEILTPVVVASVAVGVEKLGNAMETLANGLKILNGELPLKLDLDVFRAFNPDKIAADAEKARQTVADNMDPKNQGNVGWAKVLSDLFWGAPPDIFWSDVWNMIGPTDEGIANLNKDFEGIRTKIVDDWNAVWSGKADRQFADMLIQWFPGQADFINGVTGWIDDVFSGKWFDEARVNIEKMWNDTWRGGGNAEQMLNSVLGWLRTNIGEPFGRAMDSIGKLIPESFKSDVSEWGLGPAVVNWINNSIMPEIGKGFEEGWKNIAEGRWGSSVEGAAKWDGFWKDWNQWWSDDGTVGDINRNVNEWFENSVFKPLREAWDNAWKAVTDWLSSGGGGESSNRSDTNGQDFWNSFWGGFAGMGGDIGKWADGINATVNDWLDTNVWKPIGDWVKDLDWGQIGDDLWNGFISGLTGKDVNAWEKIGQGFTGWVDDMKNFFGIHSPSTLMFDIATDIVQGLIDGFGGLGAKIGEAWAGIGEWITTKLGEIKTNVDTFIADFKLNWDLFWGGLGAKIGEVWDGIIAWITTKAGEIQTNIGLFIETVKTNWNLFWDGVWLKVQEVWTTITTWITTKYTEIQTNISNFITTVKTNWDLFWDGVRNKVTEIWNAVTAWIVQKAGEIRTNITNFITTVRTNWDNFWTTVRNKVTEVWNAITGWIAGKIAAIRGNITGFISTVTANWNAFWGNVKQTVATAWENIKTGVSTGIENVLSFVRGLPGRVTAALGNLGGLLLSAGTSILQGLWDGMIGKWNEMTGWISGLAGWIAANKGPIEYDRRLLEPAGKAIMDGLDNGLKSRMDPLLNTLQTITAAVTGAVTADLSKSVMYATGRDAAQGLADGLKANRASVHTALGDLGAFTMPSSQVTVGGAFAGSAVGRPTADVTPGRSVTIAEGAISITTPTKSPELVAAKVIDSFVSFSSF